MNGWEPKPWIGCHNYSSRIPFNRTPRPTPTFGQIPMNNSVLPKPAFGFMEQDMTSTHTARIKPKADNSPILDSRGPKYKRTYPWWWRSPKNTTIHNAMSVYAMELAMNRYELGRRFLIQTQSKPASMCISIESMLKRKPHFENDLLVSLGEFGADMSIETSLVPDWGFLMKSIDELPKRLPSKKTPWKRIGKSKFNLTFNFFINLTTIRN